MPVLFIGHGSPLNIIEDNSYTRSLVDLANQLPIPKAIVVISAHWQTDKTHISSSPTPQTIYDFYGFPDELYQIKYNCPGSPEIAAFVQQITQEEIRCEPNQGIDHAGWAVLNHMYPHANIPTLEISLDVNKSALEHYRLGKKLAPLREEGVLVIGSGNIVHNLSRINFSSLYGEVYPWAAEYDGQVAKALITQNHSSLIDYQKFPYANIAVPTNEHYLPMLYTIALQKETDKLRFTCTDIQNGSISMRSFILCD